MTAGMFPATRARASVQKPLLAYAVQEEDEGTGGIVFARSSAEARRRGSSEFGDGDFNWGKATRLTWADKFAPGPVPFVAMFDRGWWQECRGCGCTIRQDGEEEAGVESFEIVEVPAGVYCTPACRTRFLRRKYENHEIGLLAIEELARRILKTMPGALICGKPHAYVDHDTRRVKQAVIGFQFPGARYLATYRFDQIGEDPRLWVPQGDRAAFFAWRAAGYPPHLMDAGL